MPSTRSVCWHEAHHAASLIVAGMAPLAVRIDNHPDEHRIGTTKADWEANDPGDPDVLREVLVGVIMAPLSEGESQLRLDHWPIDPDRWMPGNRKDAEQAAFLADRLRLDQVGWGAIIHRTESRARQRGFRRLVVELAEQLERTGLLFQRELVAIGKRMEDRCST